MRRSLNFLYTFSGGLAACFMAVILILQLTSIVSRYFNFYIAGLNAYAGYSMAASGFLALAYTFTKNEHIRVTLVSHLLSNSKRRLLYLFALLVALVIVALVTWHSMKLVFDSYQFQDISTDDDATALWIPQLSMAIGSLIFLIALADELIATLRHSTIMDQSTEVHNYE